MVDIDSMICPAAMSGILDNFLRRRLQNPHEILKNHVKEGMVVLDLGCGPGYFTIPAAKLVGNSGKVIAADLQEEMLGKVKKKISGTELENRIVLHKTLPDKIGLSGSLDFALAIYMLHEIPDAGALLGEIYSHLNSGGLLFYAEPKIHVSKKVFKKTVDEAVKCGFSPIRHPRIFFSRAVILQKN